MNCGYADISNYFYIQLFHIFAVAGPIHVAKSQLNLSKRVEVRLLEQKSLNLETSNPVLKSLYTSFDSEQLIFSNYFFEIPLVWKNTNPS